MTLTFKHDLGHV